MTNGRGLARHAHRLPGVDDFVSLGEGETPLVPLDGLARHLGVHSLMGKMESQNPTGSYKDRVAAMSLSLARHRGCRGWIATSSGNAGLAMAAYGTRADLPGYLCMVASAPTEKRLPLMPYDVHVALVEGIGLGSSPDAGPALMEAVRSAATRHDLFLGITAHAYNDEGMRGVDTIAYELGEQAPSTTHIYVPTGGGGLLTATARGLADIHHPAKVIACQPSGCAPIVRYLDGELPDPVLERCDSTISALQLPAPPDGHLAARSVTASGGWGTAVPDDDILMAQRLLAHTEGIFVEPASAAALASILHDIDRGRIDRTSQVVMILTGAGWKDLGRLAPDADQFGVVAVDGVAASVDAWAAESFGPDTAPRTTASSRDA